MEETRALLPLPSGLQQEEETRRGKEFFHEGSHSRPSSLFLPRDLSRKPPAGGGTMMEGIRALLPFPSRRPADEG
eukprot:6015490-Pyramimonas_sp.AAC.1